MSATAVQDRANPMSEWYYTCEGKELGPISNEELEAKLSSGELGESTTVWREGMSDWVSVSDRPASEVVEEPAAELTRMPEQGKWELMALASCVLFFVTPFPIIAFISALQANNAYKDGRMEDAVKKLHNTKRLLLVSVGLGVVIYGVAIAYLSGAFA